VYGSLPSDPVGGGRPAFWLPRIGLSELSDHVSAMAALGIGFAYTLNAPDLFGAEDDPGWRRELDRHLHDLWQVRIRRLIVSNHWLAGHLRDHHEFSVSLSLIRGVATAGEARRATSLGVDEITLHGQRVNRDLSVVAAIREVTT
jgi:hypothetical protein